LGPLGDCDSWRRCAGRQVGQEPLPVMASTSAVSSGSPSMPMLSKAPSSSDTGHGHVTRAGRRAAARPVRRLDRHRSCVPHRTSCWPSASGESVVRRADLVQRRQQGEHADVDRGDPGSAGRSGPGRDQRKACCSAADARGPSAGRRARSPSSARRVPGLGCRFRRTNCVQRPIGLRSARTGGSLA
jgi:hypothetical protein